MSSIFQPSSVPPVSPDDALADLEATFGQSVDPPQIVVVQDAPPPIGRSWAFNWDTLSFDVGQNGDSPQVISGLLTLVQWAEKCLRTERGSHPIHPPEYGLVGLHALWGSSIQAVALHELEENIADALTFHPRITAVSDFDSDFDPGDEWIAISFTLIVDDDTRLPVTTTLSLTSPGVGP